MNTNDIAGILNVTGILIVSIFVVPTLIRASTHVADRYDTSPTGKSIVCFVIFLVLATIFSIAVVLATVRP